MHLLGSLWQIEQVMLDMHRVLVSVSSLPPLPSDLK